MNGTCEYSDDLSDTPDTIYECPVCSDGVALAVMEKHIQKHMEVDPEEITSDIEQHVNGALYVARKVMREMTPYEVINDAVNAVYFGGDNEDRPVYLDLEDEYKTELASRLGCSESDVESELASAVFDTLIWNKINIYDWHTKRLSEWFKLGGIEEPPFSALLLAFSVAAENMRQGDGLSKQNYYGRLAEFLCCEEEVSKISTAGKSTEIFWQSLNQWLLANDLHYGIPTAKQVNNWRYVSYAISQALVRKADRARLHSFFSEYGYIPGESVSASEITPYLDEWMLTSGASPWLKTLWATEDLKDRVVSSALDELKSWKGDGGRKAGLTSRVTRLFWVSVYSKKFLKEKLSLYLATSSDYEGELSLGVGSSEGLGEALIGENGCKLWMQSFDSTFNVLETENDAVNLSTLLHSEVVLDGSINKKFSKSSKPILVFAKSETGTYFVEVTSVNLLKEYMILCHESWAGMIGDHLQGYASEGYQLISGEKLNLPQDWCVFKKVVLNRIPDNNKDYDRNLLSLVPKISSKAIRIEGGLMLARSIWHSAYPPKIMALDESGPQKLQITSPDSNYVAKIDGEGYSYFSDLGQSSIDGKFYSIRLGRGGGGNATADVSFRSANFPRMKGVGDDTALIYMVEDSGLSCEGIYEAKTVAEEKDTENYLQGYRVLNPITEIAEDSFEEEEDLFQYDAIDVEEDEDRVGFQVITDVAHESADSCAMRGHHIFQVAYGVSGRKNKGSIIRCGCGYVDYAGKKSKKVAGKSSYFEAGIVLDSSKSKDKEIDSDVILDAIMYQGAGPWSALERIISNMVEKPWAIKDYASNLSALGFIDIKYDASGVNPVSWSCSPPVAYFDDCQFVLSGFRNDNLVALISEVVDGFKGVRVDSEDDYYPSKIAFEIPGVDLESALERVSAIVDHYGRSVKTLQKVPESLVNIVPNFGDFIDSSPVTSLVLSKDLEVFDFDTLKWKKATILSVGNAYRTSLYGRKYYYLSSLGDNGAMLCKHSMAKLLSARHKRIRVHGYDSETRVFIMRKGFDLPDIYERILVSSSGCLPRENNKGCFEYHGVTDSVAKKMLGKIYSK